MGKCSREGRTASCGADGLSGQLLDLGGSGRGEGEDGHHSEWQP